MDVLQSGEQVSPTLARIDIEHYQPGDCSGDDTHIGVGPLSPLSLDLVDSSGDKHALLPGGRGCACLVPDTQDRRTSRAPP